MSTTTSRLTKKYQATIPRPVREVLKLRSGDVLAFDIRGKEIRLRKSAPADHQWSKALESTLSEWSSEADEQAYRDL